MIRKMFKRNAKLIAAVTLAVSLAAAPSAFALNSAGDGSGNGNKPFSFTGYQFLTNGASADTLELNFNKETVSPGETTTATDFAKLISVKNALGASQAFTVTTLSQSGDYDGTSHYTKGSKAILTFTSALSADALYTVEINGLAMNSNGLTLGNYMHRKPVTFKFKTPDGTGAYTLNPYVSYVVGDGTTNVSWESDLTVIFDRPMYTSQVGTYASGLNSGYYKGANPVSLGDVAGSYEAYTAKSNDTNNVNTVFFFPETKNTSTTPVFNRTQSSNTYTLTLPTNFYDVNNRLTTAYTGAGGSYTFTTVSSDYPGWEANGNPNTNITVTAGTGQLSASWNATSIAPTPTGYDVYYTNSTNGRWAPLASWTKHGSTTSTSYTLTGLTSGQSYWVRVVPYNTTGSVGFSISQATATTVN